MIRKILDNKIFKFGYGFVRFFVCLALFVYIAFVMFQRLTGNASLFGYRVFTVASGSMSPAYIVNDVIYVKEVDSTSLKVGDDVAYQGNRGGFEGLTITHRIIKIEEENDGTKRFFTQGINNDNPDPSISEEQILGKVCGKVFFINALNHIIKNIYGFFFLIFLPLVLVIVLEIFETIVEYKLDNNKIKRIDNHSDDDCEDDLEDDDSQDEIDDKVLEIGKDDNNSNTNEGDEEDEEII